VLSSYRGRCNGLAKDALSIWRMMRKPSIDLMRHVRDTEDHDARAINRAGGLVLAGTSRISLTASLGEKWPRRQSYP
jgi:hypothetical protein